MKRLAAFLLLTLAAPARAQPPVEYRISFPNAVHHEAEVEVTFREVSPDPLEIRMSRTSPGRYALHEFAKNVYRVRVTDAAGRPLTVSRPDPHQWDATGHDGTVVFRYTLFADRVDGTYSGVDGTHAHLNMPATFAWARGMEERPISITFHRPDPGYRIATQLVPTDDPERFTAPDLPYFLDSPTEISDFELRSWVAGSAERRATIRLAVHHAGTSDEVDRYAEDVRRVVDEQLAVWGEAPDFDYGTYTFIADYLPWASRDGMEHRNSTILTSPLGLSEHAPRLLGTVSHEFFHAWNVERLRPRSLEPFDFEEANMSGELWFAEGFTSYYTPLSIARAGLMDLDGYAASLTATLNTVLTSPGRRFFSPVEMSMQAPFVDAAVSVDPTNRTNTFVSYYTWGAALGLGLDLLLRDRFELDLDGYMRALWREFGRPERPYTRDDLRTVLGRFTGDHAFADEFFRRYVEGTEIIDYAPLLARAGLLLRRANPGAVWIGDADLGFDGPGAIVESQTRIGTPLYEAGVDRGDRILSIAGREIGSAEELKALLGAHGPGDGVEMEFEQRGERRRARLVTGEDPRMEVVPYEHADRPVSGGVRRFRAGWLGSAKR